VAQTPETAPLADPVRQAAELLPYLPAMPAETIQPPYAPPVAGVDPGEGVDPLASGAAEMAPEFGVETFLAQADVVILSVLGILLLMSVATWYLIINKGARTWRLRHRASKVVRRFWAAPSLAQAAADLEGRRDIFAELLRQGIGSDMHYRKHQAKTLGEACTRSDFITRALRQSIDYAAARLESGLTILASVGSTAPFIGLFGTVWGIYHALVRIGITGQASLEQIAGPVGEALIMTAVGLGVAIPAVLAYNAFVRANRVLLAQLDALAHDLHAFLTIGARVDPGVGRTETEPTDNAKVVHVARGKA
jgi:biopolymer transport protein ExbB